MSSPRWLKERSIRVESTGWCGRASLPRVLMFVRDVHGWANPLLPGGTLCGKFLLVKSHGLPTSSLQVLRILVLQRPQTHCSTAFHNHSSLKLLLKGQAMAVSFIMGSVNPGKPFAVLPVGSQLSFGGASEDEASIHPASHFPPCSYLMGDQ